MVFLLIILGVILNSLAQLLLKAGMSQVGQFAFNKANIVPVGIKVLMCPPILLGVSTYVISLGVWLLVLSRAQVSFAYPMVSLGYVVTAIAAYFIFGESMSAMRVVGILIIISGVYLISQSA